MGLRLRRVLTLPLRQRTPAAPGCNHHRLTFGRRMIMDWTIWDDFDD